MPKEEHRTCSCYSNFHNKLCEVKCDEDDQTLALCRVRQIPVVLDHGPVEAAKSLRKKIQVWKLFYFLDSPIFHHCKIWKQLLVSSGRCYAPPPSSPTLSSGGRISVRAFGCCFCLLHQSVHHCAGGRVRPRQERKEVWKSGVVFHKQLKTEMTLQPTRTHLGNFPTKLFSSSKN